MTRFYVDSGNNYIGGYDGAGAEATLPSGAVEVSTPRPGPLHTWNGSQWVAPNAATVEAGKKQRGLNVMGNEDLARVMFEAIFNHENRIRVLEAKPAITKSQLKDAIADLFKKI